MLWFRNPAMNSINRDDPYVITKVVFRPEDLFGLQRCDFLEPEPHLSTGPGWTVLKRCFSLVIGWIALQKMHCHQEETYFKIFLFWYSCWWNLHLNSVISNAKYGARYCTGDLKDFFFVSDMKIFQYMRLHRKYVTPEVFAEYNLTEAHFDSNGYCYVEIRKGMYGLKEAAILALLPSTKFPTVKPRLQNTPNKPATCSSIISPLIPTLPFDITLATWFLPSALMLRTLFSRTLEVAQPVTFF